MALELNFDKAKAEYLLDCLHEGKPIEPPEGQWTSNDILLLAGACFCGVYIGAQYEQALDEPKMPQEHREAQCETLFEDMHLAIERYAELSKMILFKEYDECFEPHLSEIVAMDGDQPTISAVKGAKNGGAS